MLFLDHLRHMHLIITCAVCDKNIRWMEIIDKQKCIFLVILKSFQVGTIRQNIFN